MTDNGISNSFEAIKAECEAAGYSVADAGRLQVGATLHCPDGASYEFTESLFDLFPTDKQAQHTELKQKAWDRAWLHYQKDKQYEAMKALLEEIAGISPEIKDYLLPNTNATFQLNIESMQIIWKAKALLKSMK